MPRGCTFEEFAVNCIAAVISNICQEQYNLCKRFCSFALLSWFLKGSGSLCLLPFPSFFISQPSQWLSLSPFSLFFLSFFKNLSPLSLPRSSFTLLPFCLPSSLSLQSLPSLLFLLYFCQPLSLFPSCLRFHYLSFLFSPPLTLRLRPSLTLLIGLCVTIHHTHIHTHTQKVASVCKWIISPPVVFHSYTLIS